MVKGMDMNKGENEIQNSKFEFYNHSLIHEI